MLTYHATSGVMDLATLAANSAIFALNNPSITRSVIVKKLLAELGFVGTAAATGIGFGVTRATGTAAAGTGSVAVGAAAKRAGGPGSICSVNWGPAAITGLTADTPGDFAGAFLNHQLTPLVAIELIKEDLREYFADAFVLLPSTSLVVFTRTISIAGSRALFNVDWAEPV
jgi:hypothetical protein